jgi:TonB family protein
MLFATPMSARAQEQPASPSPAATPSASVTCPHPYVEARIATASQPESPPLARDASGEVAVQVTLDAKGHLLEAHVIASSLAILDASALKAARNSTYRPEIFNCQAVASAYTFIVTYETYYSYQGRIAIPVLKFTAPATYFPGTWMCSADASPYSLTITRTSASDAPPTLDFESDGRVARTLSLEHGLWHYQAPDGTDLTASAWYGSTWKLARDKSELDFTRVDDNTFVRTDSGLDDKGNQTKATTRCVKSAATKV